MAQDLRNLFEENRAVIKNVRMSEGHEKKFLQRLEQELPRQSFFKGFNFLNIAASVIVLLGLAYGAFLVFPLDEASVDNPQNIVDGSLKSLGDMSPDLKKVEDYYLASINLELSKLELTAENKELVDGYMLRLKELNDEYDKLTLELNDIGLNEASLDALLNNLKFRLNLVMRLKEQLEEFNDTSFSETSI